MSETYFERRDRQRAEFIRHLRMGFKPHWRAYEEDPDPRIEFDEVPNEIYWIEEMSILEEWGLIEIDYYEETVTLINIGTV